MRGQLSATTKFNWASAPQYEGSQCLLEINASAEPQCSRSTRSESLKRSLNGLAEVISLLVTARKSASRCVQLTAGGQITQRKVVSTEIGNVNALNISARIVTDPLFHREHLSGGCLASTSDRRIDSLAAAPVWESWPLGVQRPGEIRVPIVDRLNQDAFAAGNACCT